MDKRGNYDIVARYLVPGHGWQKSVRKLTNVTLQTAGREASADAHRLDKEYGDTHFWTVDLHNPDKPEYGSYYQLFHGRLS